MNERVGKSTGIYSCPDNVANLTVRVELREVVDATVEIKDVETKIFRWQEKRFGKHERDFYGDVKNCVTDLDKKYHDEVVRLAENGDVLYTYVNDDEFCLQEENVCDGGNVSALHKRRFFDRNAVEKDDYDFMEHLRKSIEEPICGNNFVYMYIMADFGEYLDNAWLKSEHILCTLKYDAEKKLLLTHPDFTSTQCYSLHINGDFKKKYQYTIENVSEDIDRDLCVKQTEILNKIARHQSRLKAREIGNEFETPLKDKLCVHLFFEILTAKNFEYDDIYVQYFVDLPENWTCRDEERLKGVTQSCRTKNDENLAHFGFPFEVVLEYNLQKLEDDEVPQAPYVYFEVVSKDTWRRFRTEGLTYKNLPVSQPGTYQYQLPCLRILSKNPRSNLKRFFIGDYLSYSDVTWMGVPKNYDGPVINKHCVDTIGTGQLEVKINVLHQSQAFLNENDDAAFRSREQFILEKLNCSTLVKSVEQVLKAFKRARKNMIEARRNV